MYLTPQALRASSPERGAKGAPRFVAEASGRVPSPRRALPLLGEVPSAHTGERGLRGRLRCRREKTERGAEYSFPHRQSHSHGDPSVSLTLDSSPKRGAKGVDSAPHPRSPPSLFYSLPPHKKLPAENPSAIQVYHYLTIRKLRVMGAAR